MCVYLLICKLRYVGSTCRQFRIRLQEHHSRIRRCLLEAPLTQHCLEKGHEFTDFHCIVLEVLDTSDSHHKDLLRILLQRETYWIFKLKSLAPGGLNQEMDYSVFL